MSKNWLTSKPAPEPPVSDWLKWSGQDLERYIAESDKIAAIIGINKMGDIETMYSPILIPNAFATGHSAIIGNQNNKRNKPSFIYSDASDIGSAMVVLTYEDIHSELRPDEHLSPRTIADTSWASAKVKLGMVQFPMVAPIFFQQKTVTCSVHDADFEELLGEISPTHLCWAQLVREQLTQEENDGTDLDLVVQRLAKSRNKADNAKMVTAGFGVARPAESTFLSTFFFHLKNGPYNRLPCANPLLVIQAPARVSAPPSTKMIVMSILRKSKSNQMWARLPAPPLAP